jgi:Tat protein secretion system quality control protein TatD with DNase activity
LLETDAPFQTLKGEENTLPQEIEKVYQAAAELRAEKSFKTFCARLEANSRFFTQQ